MMMYLLSVSVEGCKLEERERNINSWEVSQPSRLQIVFGRRWIRPVEIEIYFINIKTHDIVHLWALYFFRYEGDEDSLFGLTFVLIRSTCRFWLSISDPMSMAMFRKFPTIVETWPMFPSISSSRASFVILEKQVIIIVWNSLPILFWKCFIVIYT
jgi:hypothetical protein